jgi:6,7-dimethyl-8-ribityllumazine synthase
MPTIEYKENTVKPFPVAIVVSRFNEEITEPLYLGAANRLQELKFSKDLITTAWVPGAIEIPLIAQRLAATKQYKAIICLGCVIRGETSHYDCVCDQVNYGCQRVALTQDIPVIFGLVTTDNEAQAFDRSGGRLGNKGKDAVDTAMEMVSVLQQIDKLSH